MSSDDSRAILVFSKSAERGAVKTRLFPLLSNEECLQLHLALLQDTLLCCHDARTPVLLYLAGDSGLPFSVPAPIRPQVDGDLGQRMKQAFLENLAIYKKVLIVGIDSPGLTPHLLEEAFVALDRHNPVLGPSEDGGYYLIGLNKWIDAIFMDIPWSTPEVLARTLEKLPPGTAHLLPRLWDVDRPEDLLRLQHEIGSLPRAQNTKQWIASRKIR